jgi:proteic killer suppression protein
LKTLFDEMKKFKNDMTERIKEGCFSKDIPKDLFIRAQSKIILILSSTSIIDLKVPPSNHLEKLNGNRKGQYSIRVNEKYRICFNWINDEAFNIEFVDYHK